MHCELHPEERLRFVCLPCDSLVCRDCKLTDHDGHRAMDITRATAGLGEKLADHKRRLEERQRVLRAVQREVQEDRTDASQDHHRLEQGIRTRVALLTLWVKQAEIAALNSLKTTAVEVDDRLDAAASNLTGRLEEIEAMVSSIDDTVSSLGQPTSDPIAALRLERDMRTGRGKGDNLEKLTEGLPVSSVRPSLLSDPGSVTEAAMKRFVGTALFTQVSKATPQVALSPLFRCTKASEEACVTSICPLPDGTVWVAYDLLQRDGREEMGQRVCLYTRDGQCLKEQRLAAAGRVSMARAYESWVFVVVVGRQRGHARQQLLMNGEETRQDVLTGERRGGSSGGVKRSPVLLSKLHTRFSLETSCDNDDDDSGGGGCGGGAGLAGECVICKVEARSVSCLEMFSLYHFTLPLTSRRLEAMDVDSTGQYFALLTLDPPSVQLLAPQIQPSATPLSVYRPRGDGGFSPSDVCFHVLEGCEYLLVADWRHSALHLLTFRSGRFRFHGFLGEGCPLVSQPTALTADDEDRLWIGCKGGQVVLCVSANDLATGLTPTCSEDELGEGSWQEQLVTTM